MSECEALITIDEYAERVQLLGSLKSFEGIAESFRVPEDQPANVMGVMIVGSEPEGAAQLIQGLCESPHCREDNRSVHERRSGLNLFDPTRNLQRLRKHSMSWSPAIALEVVTLGKGH